MINKFLMSVFISLLALSFISANSFGYNYIPQDTEQNIYPNATINNNITNIYQNITGSLWNGSATTNLDMNGYYITEVGRLLMEGIIYSEDIIPAIDDLYSLGSSSSWFSEAFITKINAENISTIDLLSINIDATNLKSINGDINDLTSIKINSTDVDSVNMSVQEGIDIGGARVYQDGDVTVYRGA